MVTVTDSAAIILRENLEANRKTESDIFRISEIEDGLSLTMGTQEDGDTVVEHEDRPILVMAQPVAEAMGDVIIDKDAADEAGLIIKPAGHEYTS